MRRTTSGGKVRLFGKRFSVSDLSYVNPKIALRKTRRGGRGLFAIERIRKGEIVSISAGIGLPLRAVKRLPKAIRLYCYHVENGFFYCPLRANPSADWFMNHSCSPNVSSPKEAFTLRARRNIEAGEEILYDYSADSDYPPFRQFRCRCGNRNCRKIIRWS
jgi:SET domain-containing protein